MINITVDLTNINKKLDGLRDVLSVDKTSSGKQFVSVLANSSLEIFKINSTERMLTNEPPGLRKLKRRGKKLSMRNFAQKEIDSVFLAEKKVSDIGMLIGIGINLTAAGARLPIEQWYWETLQNFSDFTKNKIPYDFAGTPAMDVFLIRHFGSGSKSTLPSYIGKRLYPNNFRLYGVDSAAGKILSTRSIIELLDSAAGKEGGRSIKNKLTDDTEDDTGSDNVESDDFSKGIDQLISSRLKHGVVGNEDNAQDSASRFFNEVVGQIAADSLDNFFEGNFGNVTLNSGKSLLMWHPGVRPYDWFKDTNFGSFTGKAHTKDIEEIKLKIDVLYRKVIEIKTK